MSNLIVNDLEFNQVLDQQAMTTVAGGWGWGRIKRYARKAYKYGRVAYKYRKPIRKYGKKVWCFFA